MLNWSVSQVCTMQWPFDRDIEYYPRLGVRAIGIHKIKLEPFGFEQGRKLLRDSGLKTSCYQLNNGFAVADPRLWPEQRDRLRRDIEEAAALEAPCVALLSGTAGALSFEEALEGFLPQAVELAEIAEKHRVRIALEPHFSVRPDASFVHTLHDALDIAERVASPWFGVCCELTHAWMERHLYENLRARTTLIAHVQTGDFKLGTRCSTERVPLGDGIMPLGRMLGTLDSAGYRRYCEVELVGPDIEAIGYEEALRRSLAWLAKNDEDITPRKG